MIILSDCFTEKVDEGCLKVANSLAVRLRQADASTLLVSTSPNAPAVDLQLQLNKLFLNRSLAKVIKQRGEPVLYIPFSSNTTASILRTCVLSLMSRGRVSALFALRHPMGRFTRFLLRRSRASVVALSKESWQFFHATASRTLYLRTGVDTGVFLPVDDAQKAALRDKYGIPMDKPVVLHVGHLKAGRNVERLLELRDDYLVLLVVSSATQQDAELRTRLESRPNIRIIDRYVQEIQELYQLADAYLFPVEQEENCIDIPLSALEAASCGIPVVTTPYGELRAFSGCKGFRFLESTRPADIDAGLASVEEHPAEERAAVLPYDWLHSIEVLRTFVSEGGVKA